MSVPTALKLLIIYGTTEGQTRKIAKWVNERLETSGHNPVLCDSTAFPEDVDIDAYDGVIILGSVHQGQYQSSLIHLINQHLDALQKKPSALLSVSLSTVLEDNAADAEQYVEKLQSSTGWHPTDVEHVAGALVYTQYDFLKRQMMKLIVRHAGGPSRADQDYEFTDWFALGRFIDAFCDKVNAKKPYAIG